MSLRRIAGVAVAAIVASGAGLLLSGPSGAVTPPTPITLNLTGMASSSCPLPLNGSMAVLPNTTVLLKNDVALAPLSTESVTIKPAPDSIDPTSSKSIADIPDAGAPIAFTRAATYSLTWQVKTINPLGLAVVTGTQTGKLIINANARGCVIAVQIPVPSVSATVVPSPIISGINGAIGGVVSSANGALGPVNSALPTLPTAPALPGVNPPVVNPPGVNLPGASTPGGAAGPGTTYKPTGPTVADRTVPDGYGNGSGLGGLYVPGSGDSATGNSITAPGQQQGAGNAQPTGAAAQQNKAKPAGSPGTVEVASSRPRSALGALPTLAVVLAILALSGATAFYARTFLLQPAKH